MKLTIEELRKVYSRDWPELDMDPLDCEKHDAAILAVYLKGFKDGAERQRAVEPTDRMASAGMTFDGEYDGDADVRGIYRAMQSVAPLVVPEE